MKRFLYALALISAVTGCENFNEPHFKDVDELYITTPKVYVLEEGGDIDPVQIYSNGTVEVTVDEESAEWATLLSEPSFEKDGEVRMSLAANESLRRMAKVILVLDNGRKVDTLKIYQHGQIPVITARAPFATVDGSVDDEASFVIETNVDIEEVKTSPVYRTGDDAWISDVEVTVVEDSPVVKVKTLGNAVNYVSKGEVVLTYKDDWDEMISTRLQISRLSAEMELADALSYTAARLLGTAEGTLVEEDLIVEGVVISDCNSPNMELNPSVEFDEVDVDENYRTAYIQAPDGSYGFRLKFDDKEDNVLLPGGRIYLTLKGAVVTKELDPERYTISSLTEDNIIGGDAGATIVEKRKTLAELTDNDVYTWVEVLNTEFVNKIGSYTNVREDFSLPSDFNQTETNNCPMDGWASLLMDQDGRGIYAMVNFECPWRRTGAGVPQGSGSVKGIIVHHENHRYGDMGRYQIRVIDESGFSMDNEAGYSSFKLWNGKYKAVPEDGEGTLIFTELPSATVAGAQSYNKLVTSGNGTISGAAIRLQADVSSWYRWDETGALAGYNGVVAQFSTADVPAAKQLVAYVSFCAGGVVSDPSTFKYYPLHWCLEYSVDGGNTYTIVPPTVNSGKEYVHMRTSPWQSGAVDGVLYLTNAYSGVGFTDHIFCLPDAAKGVEDLQVRLRPYDRWIADLHLDWRESIETYQIQPDTKYANDLRIAAIEFLVR